MNDDKILDPEELSFKDQTRMHPRKSTGDGDHDQLEQLSFKDQTREPRRDATVEKRVGRTDNERSTSSDHRILFVRATRLGPAAEDSRANSGAAMMNPSLVMRRAKVFAIAVVCAVLIVVIVVAVSVAFGTGGSDSPDGLPIDVGPPQTSAPTQVKKAFESSEELLKAVDLYIMVDPNMTAEYGATMNDWDVSRIQVFDGLFDGYRNPERCPSDFNIPCSFLSFNEDLNRWNTSNAISMKAMFNNSFDFNGDISTWDVSKVTSMESLLKRAIIFNRDLSQWNTGSVMNMRLAFQHATLFNQPIGTWNVSSVITMQSMFQFTRFFNQDLSSWDVGAVANASEMFHEATALNQDFCAWRTKLPSTAKVWGMFTLALSCPVLEGNPELGFGGQHWCRECNTNTVFETTAELYQAVDLYMRDPTLTAQYGETMNDWDVSRIKVFDRVFDGSRNQPGYEMMWCQTTIYASYSRCKPIAFNEDLTNWNMSSAISMKAMFNSAIEFNGDISTWDVSKVTNMTSLFQNAKVYNRDLSSWNTGSVTSLAETFLFASAFNQPIGNWNVSRVSRTDFMFYNATSFNQDLSNWNVGAVTNAWRMFFDANTLNQDFCAWRTKLPPTADVWGMFWSTDACPAGSDGSTPVWGTTGRYWCHVCNLTVSSIETTLDLYQAVDAYMINPTFTAKLGTTMNDWDVSKIQVFDRLFDGSRSQARYAETIWCQDGGCPSILFNEDLNNWNMSNAVSMKGMFNNAHEFNGDISSWDVSSVTSMEALFLGASVFNRDLTQWNTSSVTSLSYTFRWASRFNQDLSSWDVGAITQAFETFVGARALNQNYCPWRTKLPSTANVSNMFRDASSCPSYPNGTTPVLGASGPSWCHVCDV